MITMRVFYTPRMVADSGSFSPSAAKPAAVVADWRARGLPVDLATPPPITIEQLSRAHDRAHVEAVLACRADNGFGNRSPAVAATLLYTNGAMLAAARHALAQRTIACAPVSGFHHANVHHSGAYCTFNGLVVAALALHHEDDVARIGILDYDQHYGDGTDAIIAARSITCITHYTAGAHYDGADDAPRLLAELRGAVRAMAGCDVVLYQAGADQHVDDPLGGVLTTAELAERDRIVFEEELRAMAIPVAWNLAGGYQKAGDGSIPIVLEIHRNTALAALAVLEIEP